MSRTFLRTGAALVALGAVGFTASEAAAAKTHRATASTVRATATAAQSAVGDFKSALFHFQFQASRAAGAPETAATGNLTASLELLGTTLTTVSGPVTCLDVVGRRAALFYPITSADPFVLSLLRGVLLYVQEDAAGKPQSINYLPLISNVSSCAPVLPGILPITSGTLTLTS